MSSISANLTSPPDNFSTTLSSGISDSALSIPLNSVAGLATEGVGVIFTKDTNGDVVAGSVEIVHWTGIGGSTLTLTNVADRGLTGSDSGAQAYSAGAYFEVWVTSYYYKSLRDGVVASAVNTQTVAASAKSTPINADSFPLIDSADSNSLKETTIGQLKANLDSIALNAHQGFLINGKIVPSVASNNLTVAIKTLAGTDASSTNPIYVRIGDTVRSITAALSVTKNAGTNWFNAGSSELATKEIDYFVYLGYNATDGVVIGFSRMPGANQYSDFSTTTTNEKYCAISTITNATSTDYYENVGRFAATLGVSATYLWTVPTFTAQNLIQRPIYESRKLSWTPTITCSGSMTFTSATQAEYFYKISGNKLDLWLGCTGTTGGTASNQFFHTIPFSCDDASDQYCGAGYIHDSSNLGAWGGMNAVNQTYVRRYDSGNWALGAGRGLTAYFVVSI